jgi:hypothetical protein
MGTVRGVEAMVRSFVLRLVGALIMPEPITIGMVLSAAKGIHAIAQLVGLLESVDSKLDQLKRSKFAAGIEALRQASLSENHHESLLMDARRHLTEALALEKGHRLIMAHLALAACHHWLGDTSNRDDQFDKILAYDPRTTFRMLNGATDRFHDDALEGIENKTIRQISKTSPWVAVYGAIKNWKAVVSAEERMKLRRASVMRGIESDPDSRATFELQKSVSEYRRKPINWINDLG